MKTKKVSALLTMTLLATALPASASFQDLKRQADEYRDSGRLEQDHQAAAERARLAEIPNINRHRLQSIRETARHEGGLRGKIQIGYNAEGLAESIEFVTGKMHCQMNGNSGLCIETKTLEQWDCLWNYFWDFVCMRKRTAE